MTEDEIRLRAKSRPADNALHAALEMLDSERRTRASEDSFKEQIRGELVTERDAARTDLSKERADHASTRAELAALREQLKSTREELDAIKLLMGRDGT